MNFFISIFISGLLALFSSVSANFEFFNGTWEGQGLLTVMKKNLIFYILI